MRSLFRLFTQQPLAAKVPEITVMFWVVKILTTAAGEAISDYLSTGNKAVGALIEIIVFAASVFFSFVYLIANGALDWGPVKQIRRVATTQTRTTTSTVRRVSSGSDAGEAA